MGPLSAVVCLAFLALAEATEVSQCPGESFANLENVQFSSCDESPCELKRGSGYNITLAFEPEKDVNEIRNEVTTIKLGIPLPFDGVENTSICDTVYTTAGDKASCPLKAGTKYVYKGSFLVPQTFPAGRATLHWALRDNEKDAIICFQVDVKVLTN